VVDFHWAGLADRRYRDQIVALHRTGFLDGHGLFLSDEERVLFSDPQSQPDPQFSWTPLPALPEIALAVEGDVVIGALTLWRHKEPGGFAVVEPMNVLPGHQRAGTGAGLWELAKQRARAFGHRGIQVWAIDRNIKATNFYGKVGCRVIGQGEWSLGDHKEPATGFQYNFSQQGR